MGKFILKRVLSAIPVLFIILLMVFCLMRAIPGNPLYSLQADADMTDEQLQIMQEKYGLNGSVFEQFWRYLKNIAKGDWGTSYFNGEEVFTNIFNHMEPTLMMTGLSTLITLGLGIPIGINCDAESLDNATCIAYANDDSLDWDIIYRSNPYATSNPGTIHSTFYKTWHNERAMELVQLLRTVPDESPESIAYWEELAALMAEDVPFIIFSGTTDYYVCAPGLNLNRQGAWRYFFNAYWDNPAEHMDY